MKTLWEALGLATIKSLMKVIASSALRFTYCAIAFDWLPTNEDPPRVFDRLFIKTMSSKDRITRLSSRKEV